MIKIKEVRVASNTDHLSERQRLDRTLRGRELSKATRIHIFLENETILQQLFTRRERPYKVYQREVLPGVFEAAGLPADTKVNWSQKAGCACGCSPGFIVQGNYGKTIFVDIKAE